MRLKAERIVEAVEARVRGFDALAALPLPDLFPASTAAMEALEEGRVPARYGWTREKTERAYRLKGYGEWARSVIVAAKFYHTDDGPTLRVSPGGGEAADCGPRPGGSRPAVRSSRAWGTIARFTWRNNYRYLTDRLNDAAMALSEEIRVHVRAKTLSNYTAVPEKPLFAVSGLARFGKNGVLIHPRMGSLFVVGELFTDIEVDEDPPIALSPPRFEVCGTCRRCMDACPAQAIPAEGVVNAARCLQYLSEDLVPVPLELREKWGNRIYGCSVCLDVCPLNDRLEPRGEKHGTGYVGPGADLIELLGINDDEWRRRFSGNQIGIRDRRSIMKNAILALGWLGYRKALDSILPFLQHEHEVVRSSAVWAARRIGGSASAAALASLARRETSALVREELERAL